MSHLECPERVPDCERPAHRIAGTFDVLVTGPTSHTN
jgi:hypothetical protein